MYKRIVLSLVAAATVLAFGAVGHTAPPPENAVTYWSRIAEQTISVGRPPASSQALSGIVHSAIYDAVAATEGGLEPFMVTASAPEGALPEAAVAKAARDVLAARVPGQLGAIDTAYATFIGGIPDSQAKTDGLAVGEAIAAQTVALRAGDRFNEPVTYVDPVTPVPGLFQLVGPPPPVDVRLQQVVPYTFGSPSDFRPGPPVNLDSGEYAASFDEVKAYGGTNADTARTAEQTDVVRFWLEQAYVQWSRTLRGVADGRGLDLRQSARLLGLVHVAAADTMIACWEAKYHYLFWRPIHAIRRADTDGNAKTEKDETWTHLVAGNHPEYPSGHACITGAYTEGLQAYFRTDNLPLTIDSNAPLVVQRTRSYERLSDVREEVVNARVWGGLHFRSTMEETAPLPRKIVAQVAAHHFREARGNG